MAVLQDSASGGKGMHLFDLQDEPTPPKGTFPATVIDIKDEFDVERPSFNDPSKMEKQNLTAFLFGFRDRTGTAFKIDSRPMRISGNEKAALYGFLKGVLGEAPKMGWDYMELKGRKVLLTIEHKPSRDGDRVYANIATISPLPEGFSLPAEATAPKAKAQPAPVPPPAAPVDTDEEIPF